MCLWKCLSLLQVFVVLAAFSIHSSYASDEKSTNDVRVLLPGDTDIRKLAELRAFIFQYKETGILPGIGKDDKGNVNLFKIQDEMRSTYFFTERMLADIGSYKEAYWGDAIIINKTITNQFRYIVVNEPSMGGFVLISAYQMTSEQWIKIWDYLKSKRKRGGLGWTDWWTGWGQPRK